MSKFHISPDGSPRSCSAKPGNCKYGADYPHFSTAEDARAAFELAQGGNATFNAMQRTREKAIKKKAFEESERKRLDKLAQEKREFAETLQRISHLDTPKVLGENTGEVVVYNSGRTRRNLDLAEVAAKEPRAEKTIDLAAALFTNGNREEVSFSLDEEGSAFISFGKDNPPANVLRAVAEHVTNSTNSYMAYHSELEDGLDAWGDSGSYFTFEPDFTAREFDKFETPR